MSIPFTLSPVFKRICEALPPDISLYLVGGAVRDFLRSHPIHDFDFALSGNALEIGRKIANHLDGAYFPLDIERQTARVIFTDDQGIRNVLDFAAYRGDNLESDLCDRDFTINSPWLWISDPRRNCSIL